MHERGWRAKLAKKRGYEQSLFEQSLFEHSLIESDVLLTLLPILSDTRHYGLSEAEQEILIVAVFAHDVRKETDAWQSYVRSFRDYVPHIIPDLTREVIPPIGAALGFVGRAEGTMAVCAEFHYSRPGRSDSSIMEAVLSGDPKRGSDRFLALAHLVKAIGQRCSAASPRGCGSVGDDPALGHHLVVFRHEVSMRVVSTALLYAGLSEKLEKRFLKSVK